MTKWKTVKGTMTEEPKAVDMTTSPTTVYERRNIKKVVVKDNENNGVEMWEYEERQMSIEEYEGLQNALETPAMQLVMQTISNLELSIAMQGVE